MRVSISPMLEDGKIKGGIVVMQDISDFKALEETHVKTLITLEKEIEARKKSEGRLRTLINAVPDIICFKNANGCWIEANESNLDLFNLKDADYHGKKDGELADYSSFYREVFLASGKTDEETWQTGKITRKDEAIPRPEGSPKVYDVIRVPIFDSEGNRESLVVVGRDITEQKKMQESLERSEFNLNQAQSVAEVGSWHLDIKNNILIWSEETYRIFDIKKGTPMNSSFFMSQVHPDDLLQVQSAWQAALEGDPYDIEHRIIAGNRERWVREKAIIKFDDEKHPFEAVGTVHNITDRKKAEQDLNILGAAVRQSPFSIVITDTDGNLDYVNPAFCNLTGYTEKEALGKNPSILKSGNTSKETYDQLWEAISSGKKWYGQFHNRKKSGELYWEDVVISPIIDKNGQITHLLGIKEDITERKKIEESLRLSEEKFRNLVEYSNDWIWEVNAEGVYTYASPLVKEILGYAPEEIIGKTPFDLMPQDEAARIADIFKKISKKGEPIVNLENVNQHRDGRFIILETSGVPVFDGKGRLTHYRGVDRDITKRKQTEKLLKIQRDLGMKLGVSDGLTDALQICLDSALTIGHFDCGGIYLVNSEKGDIDLVVHKNLPLDLLNEAWHFDSDSPQVKIIIKGEPVYRSYSSMMGQMSLSSEQKYGRMKHSFRSIAVIPILHKKNVIAAMNIVSKTHNDISEYDKYALETIATQVASRLTKIEVDQALKESQQNLNSLFQSLNDFLFVLDLSGKIIGNNDVVLKRLGYSLEELHGMNVLELHPPERRQETSKIVTRMIEGKTTSCPVPLQCKDGGVIPVETKITFGKWDNQNAMFGISRDISDRLKAEKEKKSSDERLWAAIEAIDEGFVVYDSDDRLSMFNAKYLDIYKKSKEVLVSGNRFEDILRYGLEHGQYPEAAGREEEWLSDRMSQHRSSNYSIEQKLPDDRWLKISERKTKEGSIVGFRVDITNLKQSEAVAQKALKEKEALLKEIHHRVKNNMQVMSSLMSIQADKIDEPKMLDVFTEAEVRIQSMAFIHEVLYQSESFTKIQLQPYFENLVNHILQVYSSQTDMVDLEIIAEKTSLNVEHAVPCGLIVTEIITNSLKYGIPKKGTSLKIRIKAGLESGKRLFMTIADNGAGIDSNLDLENTSSLGIRLIIELISDQLEGDYNVVYKNGVSWTFSWPVSE